ncbi:hypothetical protein [Nocardia brasiliensis]|uniref:hypothetical protein n=1 Tax=Nocardia brasiliensis TaxID=37326 RepID=UPI002457D74D|nr:hypothetical protein [Nocardia brasiliensis]
MLDIDDPSEVLAAASRFTDAVDVVNGQVAQVARDLTPHERPGSAIDAALVARADWVRAAFEKALAESGARAAAVHRRTRTTVRALADTDAGAAAHIDRTESN